MSLHPALQHARDVLLPRRGLRHEFGHRMRGQVRHAPLQAAYSQVPFSPLSFKVLFCPSCLRGQVVDLVREVPAEALKTRKLGVQVMRQWRLECPEEQT